MHGNVGRESIRSWAPWLALVVFLTLALAGCSIAQTPKESARETVPVVTIEAGTSPVTEGTVLEFTVTANPAPEAPLTVNVSLSEFVYVVAVDWSSQKPVHGSDSERRCNGFDEQEAQAPDTYDGGQLEADVAENRNVVGAFEAEPGLEVRSVDLAPAYLPYCLEVVQEAQMIQIDRVLGGFLRMGPDTIPVRVGARPFLFVRRRQGPARLAVRLVEPGEHIAVDFRDWKHREPAGRRGRSRAID